MQLKASAPGSLMLLGEYAVLHGKAALLCAVDKRITVTLSPRQDTEIHISSPTLGDYKTDLSQLRIEKPFHFVLGAIEQYKQRFKFGCDLHIVSEFSDKVGFGSSAAVTVATLAALAKWHNVRLPLIDLAHQGRNVVRQVQGVGSGADIAASVFGGMVAYTGLPLRVEKFSVTHPLTALYAGFKTPTVEAIKIVQDKFAAYPALFRHLCASIGQCALDGIQCVRNEDWVGLGSVMNVQQGMMDALGVNIPELHEMVQLLRNQENTLGAKISGSGLGDCVVGLGRTTDLNEYAGMQRIPVEMTLQGVHCEKI